MTIQSLAAIFINMSLQHRSLIAQVFRFINKILFIEKKTTFQFNDVKLYPSEIHLILFIHQEQDTNATRMAERLGVTKGAVSQTLSRLEKKGILRKIKDPYNKNELTVEFTALGQRAIAEHQEKMAFLHQKYMQQLAALTHEQRELISSFLAHLTAAFDEIGQMR